MEKKKRNVKRNTERADIARLDVITRSRFTNVLWEDLVMIIRDAKKLVPNLRVALAIVSNEINSISHDSFIYSIEEFIDNFLIERKYIRDASAMSNSFNITKCYLCVYCSIIYNSNSEIKNDVDDLMEEFFTKIFSI